MSQLRELRDRGLVDMPERSVAYAAEEDAGAFLMAGPCYPTEAGRLALSEFRRAGLLTGDRRTAERRAAGDPSLPLTDAERREGGRRQDHRRR